MPWDFHRLTPPVLRLIMGGGRDPMRERVRDAARAKRAILLANLMTLRATRDGQAG